MIIGLVAYGSDDEDESDEESDQKEAMTTTTTNQGKIPISNLPPASMPTWTAPQSASLPQNHPPPGHSLAYGPTVPSKPQGIPEVSKPQEEVKKKAAAPIALTGTAQVRYPL